MPVKGIEGLSAQEVLFEVDRGAKFVVFQYCISVLILTFRRSSDTYFVRSGQSAQVKGLPYTLLSFLLGWWGIPWGFIYTPMVLYKNLQGGTDVTGSIVSQLRQS